MKTKNKKQSNKTRMMFIGVLLFALAGSLTIGFSSAMEAKPGQLPTATVKNNTGPKVPTWNCPGPDPHNAQCTHWSDLDNGSQVKIVCSQTVGFTTVGNSKSKKWYKVGTFFEPAQGIYTFVQSSFVNGSFKVPKC